MIAAADSEEEGRGSGGAVRGGRATVVRELAGDHPENLVGWKGLQGSRFQPPAVFPSLPERGRVTLCRRAANPCGVSRVIPAQAFRLIREPSMKRVIGIVFPFGLSALLLGALVAIPTVASAAQPLMIDTASEG
jgi:hypothetical protein